MRTLILLFLLFPAPLGAEVYDVGQLDLEAQRRKVVYLDFRASRCKPSQRSFPRMNRLLGKYPAARFNVVTINLDQEPGAMHHFLSRIPPRFDIYHDPGSGLAGKFRVEGMPGSYLIDRSGEVVGKHVGFRTRDIDKYEREIEALL